MTMDDLPRVDVFIPVFNGMQFLPLAVESALAQRDVDVQVVVSDNCSTDGTWEWLREQQANDPRLRIFQNESNLGLINNFNRFVDYIESPHYMVLCADDMLARPNALALASRVMDRDADIVSVYCDMTYIDRHGATVANRKLRPTGAFDAARTLRRSIVTRRNHFGIPLLHRFETLKHLPYRQDGSYSGDLVQSALAAREGLVYHIGEPLIANRYTGGNVTASVLADARRQFDDLTGELGIELSPTERLEQRLRAWPTDLAKRLFLWRMSKR